MKIPDAGLAAEKVGGAWKTPPKPPSTATPAFSSLSADGVRLSRLYQALTSSEMAGRLHNLGFRVSHRSYLVPAPEVSYSIIKEHLQAA